MRWAVVVAVLLMSGCGEEGCWVQPGFYKQGLSVKSTSSDCPEEIAKVLDGFSVVEDIMVDEGKIQCGNFTAPFDGRDPASGCQFDCEGTGLRLRFKWKADLSCSMTCPHNKDLAGMRCGFWAEINSASSKTPTF